MGASRIAGEWPNAFSRILFYLRKVFKTLGVAFAE